MLALCAGILAGRDASADELAKLLARPVSPGSLAMLARQAGKPGVRERLEAGLRSTDAASRGAAARVLDVSMERAAAPATREALAQETDAGAATEEMQTLLALGGPDSDADVLKAAGRFSPGLNAALVLLIARARATAALPLYFDTLRELDLSAHTRQLFFTEATRGRPDALIAAAALAFGHRDAPAWQAVLNAASELGIEIQSSLLASALRSDQTVFRGEASWYLAKNYCGKTPSDAAALLADLAQGEPSSSMTVDPELHFGTELLRRVLGQAPVEDGAWIACLESSTTCHLDSDFGSSPLLAYLTDREREAVDRRNAAAHPDAKEDKDKTRDKKPGSTSENQTLLRLVTGLPPGIATDLFRLESCTSGLVGHEFGVAVIEFRPDGIPRHVEIKLAPDQEACGRIAGTLFLMSRAPDAVPDPSTDRTAYLVPTLLAALECPDAIPNPGPGAEAGSNVVRVRGKVEAPKLTQRVQPAYPSSLRKRGEEGVSLYEAIITTTGCVSELRLVRSSYPELDMLGMEAISQWRYTPARLDGRPVRVYLTVTVTFRLH